MISAAHRFAAARLCAFRAGGLTGHERARVQGHLRGCARCRAALAALADGGRELRSLRTEAPDGLAERIIARLDAEARDTRLSVVTPAPPAPARRRAAALLASRHLQCAQMRFTLPIALVVGLAITAVKDLGTLTGGDVDIATACVVCGMNVVVPFALLHLGLLLASRSRSDHRQEKQKP